MDIIQPDLNWYTRISAAENLSSPRCPFASVHRCPRYYASLSMLGKAGVATSLDPQEDQSLSDEWKGTDLCPATAEQDTGISGSDERPASNYHNFCPEVSYETFGWFASALFAYVDEIDSDRVHAKLERQGATSDDWRRMWAVVKPTHYSECPLYSPLLLGVNNTKSTSQIGFNT